jgi:predicted metal-binding membrane protein
VGYLGAWVAAGSVAYAVESIPDGLAGDRVADAVVLALAAAYELSPFKLESLAHCRVPLSFVLSSWREGTFGALEMGARYGLRCVAVGIPLVAALITLGSESLAWLAGVALLLAAELLAPSRRLATRCAALVLVALAAARLLGLY